jgi:hypothetical protein
MLRVITEYFQNFSFVRGWRRESKKEISKLLKDKLFYVMHINLYGCFFSDHPCDWIYPSFSFERNGCLFLFAFHYENGYLWLKVEKVGGETPEDEYLTKKDIEWLKKLNEKDFILVYTGKIRKDKCSGHLDEMGTVQMEFKKWIGYLSVGYSELLDRIHLIFCELVDFFGAKMGEWEDENGVKRNLLEIGMEEKMKFYGKEENKHFGKDEICATYYYQGMNDFGWNKKYSYEDCEKLGEANENKQKMLSMEICEAIKDY